MSPLDSPVERISSPLEHDDTAELADNEHLEDHTVTNSEPEANNHQEDNIFGFENNYQYLTPGIYQVEPRNPSQVSGSSTDSGYQGNNHNRQRKIGWTIANCECEYVCMFVLGTGLNWVALGVKICLVRRCLLFPSRLRKGTFFL